jgi:hypothetical protein
MVSQGNGRQGGMSGPVWMLLGIVIGALGTYGGLKVLHHGARGGSSNDEAKNVPTIVHEPITGDTIALSADPSKQGVEMSSTGTVKLVANGDAQKARQEGAKVFAGFKSWAGTASYLHTNQGEFIVKTDSGAVVNNGWDSSSYIEFLKGTPLEIRASPGEHYVIFFQRKGRNPINLATVTLAAGGAKNKPTGNSVAPSGDKPDSALQ